MDRAHLSALALSSAASGREDMQDLTPQQMLAVLAIEAPLGYEIRLLRFDSSGYASLGSVSALI